MALAEQPTVSRLSHARVHQPARVVLRRASIDDCRFVYDLNSQRSIRELSGSTDPILLSEHEAWFRAVLHSQNSWIFIVQDDNIDAGVVRVTTVVANGAGVISIALGEQARGRRIGRSAIRQTCAMMQRFYPGIALDAWILDSNRASKRCFQACGFTRIGSRADGGRTFLLYQWCAAGCPSLFEHRSTAQ